jgi:hypothetical protein
MSILDKTPVLKDVRPDCAAEAEIKRRKKRGRASFPGRHVSVPGITGTDTDAARWRHKIFYRTEYDFTSEESATFRLAIYNLIIRTSGQILIDLSRSPENA